MQRRELIALLSGATAASAAWPLAAGAQTPRKIPRVGYIAGTGPTAGGHTLGAFRQGLRELGYVQGQTIALEVRWAEGRMERIPELVAELVGLKMDVLVVTSSQAALAANKATRTIPIVMVGGNPVGLGLVASLARPGGNVTGLSVLNEEIIGKRLELLKELVPGLARVAVLRNPIVATHANFWQETEVAARKLGVALQPLEVRGPETSRWRSGLRREATLRPSSPSMTPSLLRIDPGSWHWLPAAASRPCMAFASSRTRGA
jgi:putative ABC transport system substrate-binding protein